MSRPNLRLPTCCALLLMLMASNAAAEQSDLPPEVGYNYGDQEDARLTAFGGALRAAGSGITAVFSNPANLTYSQVYHIGALAQIWPEARRQSYGVAAMDSVTTRLAAGVGVVWSDQDPDGIKRRNWDVRVPLAFPFSEHVAFGLAGRYLKLHQNGLGPLGQSFTSGGMEDEAIVNGFSFDTGLRVSPSENLTFGAVGTNLSNPGTGLQPTTFGGGVAYTMRELAIEVDVVADFTTWDETKARAMGGIEYLVGENFPLRAGYRYDDGLAAHALSGGLGYISPEFSIDFGLRRTLDDKPATAVVFTLEYFVESSGITAQPAMMY